MRYCCCVQMMIQSGVVTLRGMLVQTYRGRCWLRENYHHLCRQSELISCLQCCPWLVTTLQSNRCQRAPGHIVPLIRFLISALYSVLEWWGVGVVICLERDADLHTAQLMPLPLTVSCFSKIQIGFAFLVPAHPGSPGKGPLNGCVCVCVVCVYSVLVHIVRFPTYPFFFTFSLLVSSLAYVFHGE